MACLVAVPAMAQTPVGEAVTLRGRVALDFVQVPLTPVRTHGLIDLDLIVAPGTGALPEGVGLELGLYHYEDNAIPLSGTAGFAALTFDLGGGRLAVGAPRIASEGSRRAPLPAGMTAALHPVHLTVGGVPMATVIQSGSGTPFWGLRYDNTAGPLDWSVSATRSSGATPTTDLAFGAAGEFASMHLYASGEAFEDGAGWGTTLVLGGQLPIGVQGEAGAVLLGAEYARIGAGVFAFQSLIGYGTLGVTDRLSLTASAMHLAGPVIPTETLVGLSIGYDLWNDLRMTVGALRSSNAPLTLYSVGLSRQF